ncbi:MAG: DNA-directed RNA polymerase subunit alpha C-terminal domain-containing protein [Candidatus Falkowbacteria bacterium]
MNDDRKFLSLAEQARVLLENGLPYRVIAEVLDIDPASVSNYKSKVEEHFNCSIKVSKKKTGVYCRMLDFYVYLYPSLAMGFPFKPNEEVIFKAAVKFLEVDAVIKAVEGATTLSRILQAPKIESNNIIFQRYVHLVEEILKIKILEPDKNKCFSENPWEFILQAITAKKIDCQSFNSSKDFIGASVNFLAKSIDRQTITTLTLGKKRLMETVDFLLEGLLKRESEILRQSFGLDGGAILEQYDIGLVHNLGRERVRQVREEALRKLRLASQKNVLLMIVNSSKKIELLEEELSAEKNKNSALVSDLQSDWISSKINLLTTKIVYLKLSVRARNIAMNQGFEYLYKFIQLDPEDIRKHPGAGKKSVDEWILFLKTNGLQFITVFSDTDKAVIDAAIKQKHQK